MKKKKNEKEELSIKKKKEGKRKGKYLELSNEYINFD